MITFFVPKNVCILSIILFSIFFASLSPQQVMASRDPEAPVTMINPDEPSKHKNYIQSKDSLYEETGGLYTEDDLKNAIPKDKTKTPDNFIKLNPSFEKPPMKEKEKKQQFAPPTYPSNDPFPTKAIVPKTTGKLYFRVTPNSKTSVCSASVVTSKEDNAILTAGHCVHYGAKGSWYTDFLFVPAYFNGERPYGSWIWEKVHAPYGWTNSGNYDYDKAIIRMRPNNSGTKIANYLGSNGWITNASQYQTDVRITGYPSHDPYDGQFPYSCYGDTFKDGIFSNDAYINCGMTKGSSGGAWFDRMSSESLGYIFAATSRSSASGTKRLFAVPLGDEFTNMLNTD